MAGMFLVGAVTVGVTALTTSGTTVTSLGASRAGTTASPAPASGPSIEIVPVVVQGDDAPGTGAQFQSFDRPNVTVTGVVAFTGDTNGPTNVDDVVYVDMMLVAQEGGDAPGTGGMFAGFRPFETGQHANMLGDVVFLANLRETPSGADLGLFLNDGLVAMVGEIPPGIPDRVFTDIGAPGVTDAGVVGYLADLDGSTADDSILVLDGKLLYRQGAAVPILPDETWDGDFAKVQWNGRGDLLFRGNTSLPTAMDVVVFRRSALPSDGDAGRILEEIVVQEGQPVVARESDDFVDTVLATALAEDGGWAVRGTLELAPASSNAFVLTESGFYAQEGDPVPEVPNVTLGNFTALDVNAMGDVVYLADFAGDPPPGTDEGLYLNGELLVMDGIDGNPVPGLPEGTRFADLGVGDLFVNDQRQIVFAASYTGAVSGDGIFMILTEDPCPQDVDGSGVVDFFDLLLVLTGWGGCPEEERGECPEDVNGDGRVDIDDLIEVVSAWGVCGA